VRRRCNIQCSHATQGRPFPENEVIKLLDAPLTVLASKCSASARTRSASASSSGLPAPSASARCASGVWIRLSAASASSSSSVTHALMSASLEIGRCVPCPRHLRLECVARLLRPARCGRGRRSAAARTPRCPRARGSARAAATRSWSSVSAARAFSLASSAPASQPLSVALGLLQAVRRGGVLALDVHKHALNGGARTAIEMLDVLHHVITSVRMGHVTDIGVTVRMRNRAPKVL
jgi:hypothetical protein